MTKAQLLNALRSAERFTAQGSRWSARTIARAAGFHGCSGITPTGKGLLSRTHRVLERKGYLATQAVSVIDGGDDILLPTEAIDVFLDQLDAEESVVRMNDIRAFFSSRSASTTLIPVPVSGTPNTSNSAQREALDGSTRHAVSDRDITLYGTYGEIDILYVDVDGERLVKVAPFLRELQIKDSLKLASRIHKLHGKAPSLFSRRIRTHTKPREFFYFTEWGLNKLLETYYYAEFPHERDSLQPFIDGIWSDEDTVEDTSGAAVFDDLAAGDLGDEMRNTPEYANAANDVLESEPEAPKQVGVTDERVVALVRASLICVLGDDDRITDLSVDALLDSDPTLRDSLTA